MWSLHLFFVLNRFLFFPPSCKLILQRKIALEKHMSKLFNQLWNLAAVIQTTPKWTKRKLLLFIILYFLASLVLVQLFNWSIVAELGQKYNAQEPQFPTPPPSPPIWQKSNATKQTVPFAVYWGRGKSDNKAVMRCCDCSLFESGLGKHYLSKNV